MYHHKNFSKFEETGHLHDNGYTSGGHNHNSDIVENNLFVSSIINNIRVHLKAYIEDREILKNDIEMLLKKDFFDVFESNEFIELRNSYKPFDNFVEYLINKYKNNNPQ